MSEPELSPHSTPVPVQAPRWRRRGVLAGALAVVLAVAGGGWYYWQQSSGGESAASAPSGRPGGPGGPRATPIIVEAASQEDFPVRLSAIGTVVPRTIVTVRSRVDGTLNRVLFQEGQNVRAGELLAEIDPRPFEVALAQTQGQMARDQALLANARADLERYEALARLDAIPGQQLDTQRALVRQYEAAVKVDQGLVDNSKLQLSYTRITAPSDGRAGLRQVDPGNLVRASDASGIVVITQVQPVTVVFPIAEGDLGKLLTRLGMKTAREGGPRRGQRERGEDQGGRRDKAQGAGGERRHRPDGEGAPAARPAAAEGEHRARPEGAGAWRERAAAGGEGGGRRNLAEDGARRTRPDGAGRGDAAGGRGEGGSEGGKKRRDGAAAGERGGRNEGGSGLAVEAWDREGKSLLATGELLSVDNQIDVTTGTVKVKAIFPNTDGALFPNQFVNVRLIVRQLKDATVISSAAVQRGARGSFVWVLGEDQTVSMRQVTVGAPDGDRLPVLDGLQPGEQVAVDGFDRLREGAKVEVVTSEARAVKGGPGKGGRRGKRGDGPPEGAPPGSAPAGGAASASTAPAPAAPAGQSAPSAPSTATPATTTRPQP